jgi:hypothetical protein
MASRSEEQARRRAERLEAERRAAETARRRMIIGYIVAGLMTAAVIAGIVVALSSGGGDDEVQVDGKDLPEEAAIEVQSGEVHDVAPDGREGTPPAPVAQGDLEVAAEEAGCELELDREEEGSAHLTKDFPDYEPHPPTSGDHHPAQQADGAYADPVPPQYAVHSLEHGRIEIQYSPELAEADQLELKGLFDEDPAGMLLFPNPEMAYEVAATAWNQLLGCKRYEGAATIDAIRAFRDTYRGQGPENVTLQFSG